MWAFFHSLRYWTDVIPLFAIVFAFGLDWMLARSRVLLVISTIAVSFSIAVQLIGAFCYPSSWNFLLRNVGRPLWLPLELA